MEQMAKEDLAAFVNVLAREEAVVFELCTNSLHSRRIVQFFLDNLDASACEFLVDVMIKKCNDVSRTQQGCIVIQRVLECAAPDRKKTIFDLVQRNVVSYSMDPYANYVVQYMFEMGDKESNSECVKEFFAGSVNQLACDKYASNVVEKALHFTTPEAQHFIVDELYSVAPERLIAMIQDSYGNYIIQATIALCSFRDVWMIAERLNPVLHMTPYGYKIASKLERRLKGKALNSATPMTA
jgi:pumilio RNA-binding family